MTYGVGYQLDIHPYPDLSFDCHPLSNENLVGKYKLVFYASDGDETIFRGMPHGEHICRTAQGSMELSMKEWDEIPALYGTYTIDTRSSDGSPGGGWGRFSSGCFIEHVTDWDPEDDSHLDGFKILSRVATNCPDIPLDSFYNKAGRKHFVLSRGSTDVEWWHDLLYDAYKGPKNRSKDALCGAVMKLSACRQYLSLDPTDTLPHNDYGSKNTAWAATGEGYNFTTRRAERALERYQDGRNSWMCQHLNVPATVAFRICEYVTKPPVFCIEKDDLVLVVDESISKRWMKALIFRKIVD